MYSKQQLYPLKFIPSLHYRIWGGNKLRDQLNKNTSKDNIGESWELSVIENHVSVVETGALKGKNLLELIENYGEEFLGDIVFEKYGGKFPLLIKFLDAATPLSVQVHPNDQYAMKHHQSNGKTEMWYIMDSQPNSELIIGFCPDTTKEIYQQKLALNQLEQILDTTHPNSGEVYFLPSGRVHAIGADIVLAEIQQNSDITYRIYDYNRIDKDGNQRQLHTDHALEVSDFRNIDQKASSYDRLPNQLNDLINCPYFRTSYLKLTHDLVLNHSSHSFTIYMCVNGKASIYYNNQITDLIKGQCIVVPAQIVLHTWKCNSLAEMLVVRCD